MATPATFEFSDKYLYYPPSGANNNNDYFPNSTITSDRYSEYDALVSTSSTANTTRINITSGSAANYIYSGSTGSTIKISGNCIFDTGSTNAVYQGTGTATKTEIYYSPTTRSATSGAEIRVVDSAQYTYDPSKYIIEYPNIDGYISWPTLTFKGDDNYSEIQKEIKRQQIKDNFRRNLAINIRSRANPISNIPENEQIAIETLREEITEAEFRKYIKYGFVLVKGQSGKIYQVYRNRSHTRVWKAGKIIEEVCVRIKDSNIPPTDNVIAFLNMIQIDEEEFRKMGNIYNMSRAA